MQTCQRAAPSVTACAVPPSSGRKALVFRAIQTCLSLWERCRAATERAGSLFEGAGLPPCGKTEGAASYLSRIRLTLMQTCQRAAPSVTACAVPPSSGRKALVFRTVQLVSPSGRDVAQRQRGLAPSSRELDLPQAKTEGVLQIGKIRIRFALIRIC